MATVVVFLASVAGLAVFTWWGLERTRAQLLADLADVLQQRAASQTPDAVPQPVSGHRTGVEPPSPVAPPVPTSPVGRTTSPVRRTSGRSAAVLRGQVAELAGIRDVDDADTALPAASVGACHGSASAHRGPQSPVSAVCPPTSALTGPPPWERMPATQGGRHA